MAWMAKSTPFVAFAFCAAFACGQTPPSYDFDFVTIGAPGNAPWTGQDPWNLVSGRGSVDYNFRIGRLEVTTAQWMEFVNTYSVLGGQWTFFAGPVFWGAEIDPTYSGPGQRYRLRDVPHAAQMPVAGISWREGAQFCNWLHNDKSPGLSALQSGAYDTSTWGTGPGNTFTDHHQHLPGAKFWIPTLDEWLKAAYYDPDRYGPGQAGWWVFPHRSDTAPAGGPPGQGQANTGFELPAWGHWQIPVGSYPDVASPWGLLDLAGSAAEWLEEVYFPLEPTDRGIKGSWAGGMTGPIDQIWTVQGNWPWVAASDYGIRIASAVPSPGTGAIAFLCFIWAANAPRRRG